MQRLIPLMSIPLMSIPLMSSMLGLGICLHWLPAQAQATKGQVSERDRALPTPVIFAAPPPPPDIGAPGQRSEAGSRPRSCKQATKPLTAIAPAYAAKDGDLVWGATVSAQPTFWFYVPYTSPTASGELILENPAKQQTSIKVTLPAKPGVMRVVLADPAIALVVGQSYRWYFTIACHNSDGVDGFVEGSITRKPMDAALQRQLTRASLQQRLTLFAANGLWYEALSAAAAVQCARSGDPNWVNLLQTVGLKDLAPEPIVDCRKD